jgi:hypothetical protein
MPPSRAAHETHEALLVSQFASGDQLDPGQARDAELLVSACRECAALAADLRALSRVVAWEPVAPRRRDFRLAPADAERLRGSAFSRLVRRLSLPQVGSLRPAAFGAMSIGLLFVVAGAVWPQTGQVAGVTAPAGVIPTADELVAPATVRDQAMPSVMGEARSEAIEGATAPQPDDELLPVERSAEGEGILELEAPAEVREAEAPAAEAAAAAEAPAAAESMSEEAADATADGAAATDALTYRDDVDAVEVAGKAQVAENGDASAPPAALEPLVIGATASPVPASPMPPAAESPALAAGGATGEGGTADREATTMAADQVLAPTAEGGITLPAVLLAVGTILAIGGALLLVITWFLRRSADPLLR